MTNAESAAKRTSERPTAPATPFHDVDHYVAVPRVSGLTLSPDGTRLVTTVATLNPTGTGYVNALWGVDPTGERAAYRITRSAKGESGAAFTEGGDLYFVSARPDPEDEDEPTSALWVVPAAGGEARVALSRPGGVGGVHTADAADVTLVSATVLPGADDEQADATLRKLRKKNDVQAILHDSYPVRFWDADLGPAEPRVLALEDDDAADEAARSGLPTTTDATAPKRLRDLTGDVGKALRQREPVLSPDGSFALIGMSHVLAAADQRSVVARIDVATGGRTVLLDDPDTDFSPGPVSPDSRRAVIVRSRRATPEHAPRRSLALLDLGSGELTDLAPEWDRWASPAAWLPDSSAVLVIADSDGRAPVFRIDTGSGAVTQLTDDDAAYSEVVVSPDGRAAYGVRSSYAFPAEVVRIDLASGEVTRLPGPVERPALPGSLTEIETTTDDGTRVRAWLALPDGAGAHHPAPMLLWIHGGPLGSWNAWSWRWTPWLLVAKGYAVLLPDPALSTGYGQDFIQRGWGRWGAEPFTDLMAVTDAAVARDDIDADNTAAMGGSFGGYMANWVAGHTDRFKAIVTHASLWALDQFGPTTDASFYWGKEMTPEMAMENSPHRSVADIDTPMLVIHGDKDYRVPIGEGLRLWYELVSRSGLAADENGETAHRFLYFPNENHWILTPQHAKVWYQVVENFLATHIHGQATELPAVLGLTAPTPEQLTEAAAESTDSGEETAAQA